MSRRSAPPAASSSPLVDELLAEIARFGAAAQRHAIQRWKQRLLSLTHVGVLMTLRAEGPMAMGKLADMLGVSVASATGIVERMERMGLLRRKRDATDRRVVVVEPTRKGLATLDEMGDQRAAAMRQWLDHMTPEELQWLLSGFQALDAARARVAEMGTDAPKRRRT